MLKSSLGFCSIIVLLIAIGSQWATSSLKWEAIPVIDWNDADSVEDIVDTHRFALIKNTPISQEMLGEIQQSMLECDLYNSRHAQFKIILDAFTEQYVPIVTEIFLFINSIFTYLRAGVSFEKYADTFPRYYRDWRNDDLKYESAWFWKDLIFGGYISTRVFHGNLERCPSTLDLIKARVNSTMDYQIEVNATVFASAKNTVATPAHKHAHDGMLLVLGLQGTRKTAIMDPDCMLASWRMANNTFYPFEPFFQCYTVHLRLLLPS